MEKDSFCLEGYSSVYRSNTTHHEHQPALNITPGTSVVPGVIISEQLKEWRPL